MISKHGEASAAGFFGEIFWMANEILPLVFDISSQWRSLIDKIYANYDWVSKPPSRLCFLCFNSINY